VAVGSKGNEIQDLPMFPLGTVLFPGAILPVHVFEERYRQLAEFCTSESSVFGVVLIERGSEVGGGDTRAPVGCLAEIIQHEQFEDGFKIVKWLEEKSYPRATIEIIKEKEDLSNFENGLAVLGSVVNLFDRARGLGYDVPEIDKELFAIGATLNELSYRIAELVPMGPFDAQKILKAPTAQERLDLIEDQIEAFKEILDARE
jgi:Lon protease-like protein